MSTQRCGSNILILNLVKLYPKINFGSELLIVRKNDNMNFNLLKSKTLDILKNKDCFLLKYNHITNSDTSLNEFYLFCIENNITIIHLIRKNKLKSYLSLLNITTKKDKHIINIKKYKKYLFDIENSENITNEFTKNIIYYEDILNNQIVLIKNLNKIFKYDIDYENNYQFIEKNNDPRRKNINEI